MIFYTNTLINFIYINNYFSKILINIFKFSFSFQHYLYIFLYSIYLSKNNKLNNQNFNLKLYNYVKNLLKTKFNLQITNKKNLQTLRLTIKQIKINITHHNNSTLKLFLHSLNKHSHIKKTITKTKFKKLNKNLFIKILNPIKTILKTTHLKKKNINKIILIKKSTKIPIIKNFIRKFFKKKLNTHVNPKLTITINVSIQTKIIEKI